ncbi:MAG: DUF3872 domain-containing protein [Sphingobacteriia bacterium]|nr:DUF3872 domain-containing protein [Sphingobacteriia bacterium]
MKKVIPKVICRVYIIGMILLLSACNSQLDIQQQYPFTLSAMPVPKSIEIEETVEIRMKLLREGYFEETEYYIRYFQVDGAGDLKLEDGTVLLPNDLYKLTEGVFRLYYTSKSTDQQKIDIYVEDNFGQTEQISFNFNNNKEER